MHSLRIAGIQWMRLGMHLGAANVIPADIIRMN